jgi:hypothetical protein
MVALRPHLRGARGFVHMESGRAWFSVTGVRGGWAYVIMSDRRLNRAPLQPAKEGYQAAVNIGRGTPAAFVVTDSRGRLALSAPGPGIRATRQQLDHLIELAMAEEQPRQAAEPASAPLKHSQAPVPEIFPREEELLQPEETLLQEEQTPPQEKMKTSEEELLTREETIETDPEEERPAFAPQPGGQELFVQPEEPIAQSPETKLPPEQEEAQLPYLLREKAPGSEAQSVYWPENARETEVFEETEVTEVAEDWETLSPEGNWQDAMAFDERRLQGMENPGTGQQPLPPASSQWPPRGAAPVPNDLRRWPARGSVLPRNDLRQWPPHRAAPEQTQPPQGTPPSQNLPPQGTSPTPATPQIFDDSWGETAEAMNTMRSARPEPTPYQLGEVPVMKTRQPDPWLPAASQETDCPCERDSGAAARRSIALRGDSAQTGWGEPRQEQASAYQNLFPGQYPHLNWTRRDLPDGSYYLYANQEEGGRLKALPHAASGRPPVGLPENARYLRGRSGQGFWVFE